MTQPSVTNIDASLDAALADLQLTDLEVTSIEDAMALPETGASSASSSCSSCSCCGSCSCCCGFADLTTSS